MSEDDGGLGAGMSSSKGDPRVLLALNLVLSTAFASFVVWGLSVLDLAALTLENVALATAIVFALTLLTTYR